jgi:hypothetical protein
MSWRILNRHDSQYTVLAALEKLLLDLRCYMGRVLGTLLLYAPRYAVLAVLMSNSNGHSSSHVLVMWRLTSS